MEMLTPFSYILSGRQKQTNKKNSWGLHFLKMTSHRVIIQKHVSFQILHWLLNKITIPHNNPEGWGDKGLCSFSQEIITCTSLLLKSLNRLDRKWSHDRDLLCWNKVSTFSTLHSCLKFERPVKGRGKKELTCRFKVSSLAHVRLCSKFSCKRCLLHIPFKTTNVHNLGPRRLVLTSHFSFQGGIVIQFHIIKRTSH